MVDLSIVIIIVQLVISLGGVVGAVMVAFGNRKAFDTLITERLSQGQRRFEEIADKCKKHSAAIREIDDKVDVVRDSVITLRGEHDVTKNRVTNLENRFEGRNS